MRHNNLDGQVIGRKGAQTRQRLLAAAIDMLETTPMRDLRASDMAGRAGISAATFYLYFENVEAVVLALADGLTEPAQAVIALADTPWPIGDTRPVEAFVRGYFDFWDTHRSVLRVRNLAAEEGDTRFLSARLSISTPLHQALARKIAAAKVERPGSIAAELHDLTLAATILAAMERNAAGYRLFPPRFGVSRERLVAATIFTIHAVLGSTDRGQSS